MSRILVNYQPAAVDCLQAMKVALEICKRDEVRPCELVRKIIVPFETNGPYHGRVTIELPVCPNPPGYMTEES